MSRETARYTYLHGSRPAGVIVYDEGTKVHVHHDTARTRGQHNAFDFVRLEKFGHLDDGCAPETPITERPSFKAMIAFASNLPELRAERAQDELEDQGPLANDEWLNTPTAKPDPFAGRPRFQIVRPGQLMERPRLEWLVKGVLPRAEIAYVVGAPGSGKTPFVLDLTAAISRGVDWHGRRVKKGRVVYIVAEGSGGFRSRIEAYCKAHGIGADDMPEMIFAAPNLKNDGDANALIEVIGKADCIVADTWPACFDGNENAGEDVGPALNNCRRISHATGATCMLITHPPKSGPISSRGWSGQLGAADVEIQIERRPDDLRTATISKAKDFSEGKLFDFALKVHDLGRDEDGDPETSITIEPVTDAPIVSKRLPAPGTLNREIYDSVVALNSPGESDLRAAVTGKMAEPEVGKRDRRVSKFNEALDKLVRLKTLFRVNGRISTTQVIPGGKDETF